MSGGDIIHLMVVDDHPVVRRGIALLLSTEPDLKLVAEAENGRQAIEKFRTHRPDVTLMDLQMPDARVVVLTTYAGDVQALRAIQAGARAYTLKTALDRELLDTIRAVHAGKRVVSADISFELAEHVSDDPLTETEIR